MQTQISSLALNLPLAGAERESSGSRALQDASRDRLTAQQQAAPTERERSAVNARSFRVSAPPTTNESRFQRVRDFGEFSSQTKTALNSYLATEASTILSTSPPELAGIDVFV